MGVDAAGVAGRKGELDRVPVADREAAEAVIIQLLRQRRVGIAVVEGAGDRGRAVIAVLHRRLHVPQLRVRAGIQPIQGYRRRRRVQQLQTGLPVQPEGLPAGAVGPQGGGPALGRLRRALPPLGRGDGAPQGSGQLLQPGSLLLLRGAGIAVDGQLGELVQPAGGGAALHLLGGILHDGNPAPRVWQAPHVGGRSVGRRGGAGHAGGAGGLHGRGVGGQGEAPPKPAGKEDGARCGGRGPEQAAGPGGANRGSAGRLHGGQGCGRASRGRGAGRPWPRGSR